MTSARSQDEERLFEVNVAGTGLVMEACVRADVERVVYTSSARGRRTRRPRQTADEGQLVTAGCLGIPNVDSVHEASSRRCAWRHAACSSCA